MITVKEEPNEKFPLNILKQKRSEDEEKCVKLDVEGEFLSVTEEFPILKRIKSEEINRTGNFSCHKCKKSWKYLKSFNTHKCSVCEFCGKIFISPNRLKNHQHLVHKKDTKTFKCDSCDHEALRKDILLSHMVRHHLKLEKKFKCDLCPQSFALKADIRCHLLTHERNEVKCPHCNKNIRKHKLKNHIREVHAVGRNFQCKVCLNFFKTEAKLKLHLMVHNKALNCIVCDQLFSTFSTLKLHLQVHRNLKEFKCNRCDKAFNLKSVLKTHLKIHQPKPPRIVESFDCKLCGFKSPKEKVFNEKHQKFHEEYFKKLSSRSNWLKCQKCPKFYLTLKQLNLHLKISHGSKFECDFCGKFIVGKGHVMRHIQTHKMFKVEKK